MENDQSSSSSSSSDGSTGSSSPYDVSIGSMLGHLEKNSLSPTFAVGMRDLFNEDLAYDAERHRSGSERLCYGVGITYLLGLSAGGVWGSLEGLRNPEPLSPRLRLTNVINSATRRGPFLGNAVGSLVLMYYLTLSGIEYARGKQDNLGCITAATAAGVLFKSTRGIRAAGLAGALTGGLMAAFTVANDTVLKFGQP